MVQQNQSPTRPFAPRSVVAAMIFTGAYLAAATPYALWRGNAEFLFYILVMLVMIAAIGWVHYRVRLSPILIWAFAIWGLLHMCGGLLRIPDFWPREGETAVLYNLWLTPYGPKYDQVIHAYGYGIMTWVCWQGFQAGCGQKLSPTFGMMLLCTAASTGFGALNEVIEFTATRLFAKTNVGGYENTGWDLVSNLAGAIAAACFIRWFDRQPIVELPSSS